MPRDNRLAALHSAHQGKHAFCCSEAQTHAHLHLVHLVTLIPQRVVRFSLVTALSISALRSQHCGGTVVIPCFLTKAGVFISHVLRRQAIETSRVRVPTGSLHCVLCTPRSGGLAKHTPLTSYGPNKNLRTFYDSLARLWTCHADSTGWKSFTRFSSLLEITFTPQEQCHDILKAQIHHP